MTTHRFVTNLTVPLNGQLLIAAPNWNHPLFERGVCLVVHHDQQGAVGVLLNRKLDAAISSIWSQLIGSSNQVNTKASLHLGGPHSGPVVALHQRQDLAEYSSGDGVYLAAQVDHLRKLLLENERDLKIIIGQATWLPGELDAQFSAGCWLPLSVSSRVVFSEETQMWPRAMREVGNQFVAAITGVSAPPGDLLAN